MANQEWSVAVANGGSGATIEVVAETAEQARTSAIASMGPGWGVVGEPWIEGTD